MTEDSGIGRAKTMEERMRDMEFRMRNVEIKVCPPGPNPVGVTARPKNKGSAPA